MILLASALLFSLCFGHTLLESIDLEGALVHIWTRNQPEKKCEFRSLSLETNKTVFGHSHRSYFLVSKWSTDLTK